MNYLLDQHYLDAIAQGRFTFAYGVSPWLALLIVASLVGVVWWSYRKTTRSLSPAWKTSLITLRSLVLIL